VNACGLWTIELADGKCWLKGVERWGMRLPHVRTVERMGPLRHHFSNTLGTDLRRYDMGRLMRWRGYDMMLGMAMD